MGDQNSALADPASTSASLAELAERLRDGPLQNLIKLQLQATELANRFAGDPAGRVEDLEALVRLSLSTMEQFHAFTREFAAILRELTDAERDTH